MVGFRIAVQTRCFEQPFKKALHTAASLGCDGLQIDARSELQPAELSDTGLRQLRKVLNDLNLRVSSIAFPTRRGYSNPVDLQPRVEATQAAMKLASALGARILIANLGSIPEDEHSPDRATLTDAMLSLARHGDRLGVRLALQAMEPVETLENFLSNFPEGTIALDLHPARLIAQGESPVEFIQIAGQRIAHVHATDGVYDLASGQGVEVALGRGSAEFPELLGMLEGFGYRGWLTIERRNSRQPIQDTSNAVKYLQAL